jgi:hypothetical protein
MSSSYPAAPDPFLHEASLRGYTPETLPALRQYIAAFASGRFEAAKRIEDNLRDFFKKSEEQP